MNVRVPFFVKRAVGLIALLALPLVASADVFTTDTTIGPENMTYEGADMVVSNATLTVDGPHAFASLLVGPGGTVTHSYSANGMIATNVSVLDEQQTLIGTNEVALTNQNVVVATVVVRDVFW